MWNTQRDARHHKINKYCTIVPPTIKTHSAVLCTQRAEKKKTHTFRHTLHCT